MVREARNDEMDRGRKEEELRMKECLNRGARKKSLTRKNEKQRLDSTEGGNISSVVQEGPVQHSGGGDSNTEGGFGTGQRGVGEGVTDSNINFNFNSVIKEEPQTIDTARTEVRQRLRRKGK